MPFSSLLKKIIFGFVLLISSTVSLRAQETEQANDALETVLKTLTQDKPIKVQPELLKSGAWESLSYLEEGEKNYTTKDLFEAVPDYYNFQEGVVIIKLINPSDHNQYGVELELNYSVKDQNLILLTSDGQLKDSWKFLYLDENYMALDMGDLRVFFTKTPIQE